MRHLVLLSILFIWTFSLSQDKDKFPATDIVIIQKNGNEHHLLYMDGFFLKYKNGACEVYVEEAGSNERLNYAISELNSVSFLYENKNYHLKPYHTVKSKKCLLLDSVIVTERVTLLRTPGNDYVTQYYYQDNTGIVHPIDKSLNQFLVYLRCQALEQKHPEEGNVLLTQREIKKLILEYEEICKE